MSSYMGNQMTTGGVGMPIAQSAVGMPLQAPTTPITLEQLIQSNTSNPNMYPQSAVGMPLQAPTTPITLEQLIYSNTSNPNMYQPLNPNQQSDVARRQALMKGQNNPFFNGFGNNGLFSSFMNGQQNMPWWMRNRGGFNQGNTTIPNQNIVNPIRQPLPMPAQPIQQPLPATQMPANQANTMPGFSRFPDFQQRFRK